MFLMCLLTILPESILIVPYLTQSEKAATLLLKICLNILKKMLHCCAVLAIGGSVISLNKNNVFTQGNEVSWQTLKR